MKDFFVKNAGAFEAYDAIDLICHKLKKIKEIVEMGNPEHLKELEEVSMLIDDYVKAAESYEFKPRGGGQQFMPFEDYQAQGEEQRFPYKNEGIGFRAAYPLPGFPFYTFENRGGRGGGNSGGGSRGGNQGGGGRGGR